MTARGRGHVAIISSLAGFHGWPGAPAYAASKAAVRSYGEGLFNGLRARGVDLSVVCPGFIRTPMTAILGYAELLLDRAAELPDDMRGDVERIFHGAQRTHQFHPRSFEQAAGFRRLRHCDTELLQQFGVGRGQPESREQAVELGTREFDAVVEAGNRDGGSFSHAFTGR